MSRRIPLVLASFLFLALPLLGQSATDARVEKQQLVRDLLKALDSKHSRSRCST
jgi:hypothetical protein